MALAVVFGLGVWAMDASGYVYTEPASDGYLGYQYWGSFGSGAIGGSGGTTAETYYNFSSWNYYTQSTIYMEFPMAGVTQITSDASLLHVYFESASNVVIKYAGDGDGVLTYPEGSGSTVYAGYSQASPGWAEFDMTTQIQDAIDNGYDWAKFTVEYTGRNVGSATIRTIENEGFGPFLETAPMPTPAALPVGIALLGW